MTDYLILVGKGRPMPQDLEITLEDVNGVQLEKTAAYMLRKMFEAAARDGIELKLLSGYRSPEYQREVFDRSVRQRVEGGNLGLAADIVTPADYDVFESFENTPQFEWLQRNAANYGFIMRYPRGKEDITGYIYEPWHYRYVGPYDAQRIGNRDVTLEEYLSEVRC